MPFKHGLLKIFHLIVRITVSSYKNVGLILMNVAGNKIFNIFLVADNQCIRRGLNSKNMLSSMFFGIVMALRKANDLNLKIQES